MGKRLNNNNLYGRKNFCVRRRMECRVVAIRLASDTAERRRSIGRGVPSNGADAKIFASLQIAVNQHIAQNSGVNPEGYTDGGRTGVSPYNLLIISLLLKHEIDCAEEAKGGGGVVPVELLVFEE